MYRVFYKPESGDIHHIVTAAYASPEETLPYIEVQDMIRIDSWRVNLDTKQLYAVEPPQYPTRPR